MLMIETFQQEPSSTHWSKYDSCCGCDRDDANEEEKICLEDSTLDSGDAINFGSAASSIDFQLLMATAMLSDLRHGYQNPDHTICSKRTKVLGYKQAQIVRSTRSGSNQHALKQQVNQLIRRNSHQSLARSNFRQPFPHILIRSNTSTDNQGSQLSLEALVFSGLCDCTAYAFFQVCHRYILHMD